MSTLLWAVRDALVALCATAVPAGTTIFNGPAAKTTLPRSYVLVGSDGGDTGVGDGAGLQDGGEAEQSEHPIGNGFRQERGSVPCSAWAWDGGTDLAPHRVTVGGLIDPFVAAIEADRTLGGLLDPGWFAEVTGLRLREAQTSKGAIAGAVITVSYRALRS